MYNKVNSATYDTQLNQLGEEENVPGFVFGVIKNNQIVYQKGWGNTCHSGGQPVDGNTLFRIMSIGKTMTGTAAMMLVDQGKLQLDQPISTYIPWMKELSSVYIPNITLRSLLTHSLGLIEPEFSKNGKHTVDNSELLLLDRLETYVRSVLENAEYSFPPGKFFKYDNFEAAVVGLLIQSVTKMPYPKAMEELLFNPLGMNSTKYQPIGTYAKGHQLMDNGQVEVDGTLVDDLGHYPGIMTLTTLNDLSKFILLHLNLGKINGTQMISENSIKEMHTIQKDFNATTHKGFGFNLIVETYRGIERLKNIGGGWGYLAEIIFRPQDKVGFLYMANLPSYDFQVKIKNIIDDLFLQLVDQEPIQFELPQYQPDQSTWGNYIGRYTRNDNVYEVIRNTNKLLVTNKNKTYQLQAIGATKYAAPYENDNGERETIVITFVHEVDGKIEYLMINIENKDGLAIDAGIFKRS